MCICCTAGHRGHFYTCAYHFYPFAQKHSYMKMRMPHVQLIKAVGATSQAKTSRENFRVVPRVIYMLTDAGSVAATTWSRPQASMRGHIKHLV
jgi:hypothetical protein